MLDTAGHQSRSVFAPIIALSFSAKQEHDCLTFLQKRSAGTELVTLSDESQLVLGADGRLTESGYRFNFLGFLAICRAISGGLSRLFGEISGLTPSKLIDLDNCSIPAAVGIYNTAMRVRFELLRERSILVDHTNRAIDGFLGLNHKMLDNAVFFEIILEAMREQQPTAGFYRAELVGRELRVYIIDTATRRTDIYSNPAHVFSSGWYFCNREDSGNAVKALPCLYTKFGVAIDSPGDGRRVVHVGPDLTGRATTMVQKIFHRKIDMDELQQRITALENQSLGFSPDDGGFTSGVKKWSNYLTRFGVPRDQAIAIAKNAGMVGKDIEPRDALAVFTKKVLSDRTGYDLICAVLRHARNLPSGHREKLQAVGMHLLFPKNSKKVGP